MNPGALLYYDELKRDIVAQSDLEGKLLALRRFRKTISQEIETRLLSGDMPLDPAMAALTHLADAVLIATYEMAREELSHNFGLPRCKDNNGSFVPSEFAIIGMGKLGGLELHLHS
ncbi:MAG: hypothetical protein K8R69_01490, partial [Deltaproteobacteria bacterium]|nr:hypothetical protein [Deltaproteobacteria bacterium]